MVDAALLMITTPVLTSSTSNSSNKSADSSSNKQAGNTFSDVLMATTSKGEPVGQTNEPQKDVGQLLEKTAVNDITQNSAGAGNLLNNTAVFLGNKTGVPAEKVADKSDTSTDASSNQLATNNILAMMVVPFVLPTVVISTTMSASEQQAVTSVTNNTNQTPQVVVQANELLLTANLLAPNQEKSVLQTTALFSDQVAQAVQATVPANLIPTELVMNGVLNPVEEVIRATVFANPIPTELVTNGVLNPVKEVARATVASNPIPTELVTNEVVNPVREVAVATVATNPIPTELLTNEGVNSAKETAALIVPKRSITAELVTSAVVNPVIPEAIANTLPNVSATLGASLAIQEANLQEKTSITSVVDTKKVQAESVVNPLPITMQADTSKIDDSSIKIVVSPLTITTSSMSNNESSDLLNAEKQSNEKISSTTDTKESATNLFAGMLEQQSTKITGSQNSTLVATQTTPDPNNIATQIVEHARLIQEPSNAKNSEMIIQLKPEHLGEVTLKIAVNNGLVSATFHSNNPEVRSVIEASLFQLKQELSNQGMKVDNVGVYAGLSQFSSQSQQRDNYQPPINFQGQKTDEDFVQSLDFVNESKSVTKDSGVDYRV